MPEHVLPKRQEALLRLIARHQKEGMVPAAAVLAKEMCLAGESSVTPALLSLESKGFLTIEGGVRGRQRFIRLTPRATNYLLDGLPVLGTIPAGELKQTLRGADRVLEHLDDLVPWETGDFLLEVEGDSMIGLGIHPGDMVLLRPGEQPRPGEVAAVQVFCPGAHSGLKRVYVEPDTGTVRLQSAHPAYPDQEFPRDSVQIAGVMRGLVRSLHPEAVA